MRLRRHAGMTLLELLIVITLIMLMVGFSAFNYQKIVAEQREGKARNECREYVKALKAWENKRGVGVREYVTEDGRTNVNCPVCSRVVDSGKNCRRCGTRLATRMFELQDLQREYIIKTVGDDPWSVPYSIDTTKGFVFSCGPNRAPGSDDRKSPYYNIPGTDDDVSVPFRPVFRLLRARQDERANILHIEFSRAVDRTSVTTVTVTAGAPVAVTTISMDMTNPYLVQAQLAQVWPKTKFEVTVPGSVRSRDGTPIATDGMWTSTDASAVSST